ncbi:MAG: dihydrolipoyl dehydrogenase [Flavobacteriaceae bacterium]|nr:MAG: dihydrolipoyl dehydrogenase [Flavobacteriaceae bacterium]
MKFDVIVIGSGPGGYVAAIRAAQLGFKTAIVEKDKLGGICLNWGCIPTKALLKSASVLQTLLHADQYGIEVAPAKANIEKIVDRSREVAQKMNQGIHFLMKKNNISVLEGFGKILPGKIVEVSQDQGSKETYSADHIILATGARSKKLDFIPQDGKYIIGYREALTLKELPKTLTIIGSGAIGVEFAYYFQTMGVEVTLVEYLERIVPLEDAEISRELEKQLKKLGVNILTSTKVNQCLVENNQVKISTETGDLTTDMVLSAVGIQTNLENIGLEEVGIQTEKGKIVVGDYFQTSISGYYAIGDIVKGPDLAHLASAQGIACVENFASHKIPKINYNNIPSCIYTQPEIASVGYTEEEAKAENMQILVGKFPFSASGKATANGQNGGFVKVIFDAKYGQWLGCHMIGTGVTELISEVVVARELETTGFEILKSIHPHPTLSEALMEAVADAYKEAIHI